MGVRLMGHGGHALFLLPFTQRVALQGASAVLVAAATPGLGNLYWLAGVALTPFVLSLRGLRGPGAFAWGLTGGFAFTALGKWSTFTNAVATLGYTGASLTAAVALFFAVQAAPVGLFAAFWQGLGRWRPRMLGPWLGGFLLAACFLVVSTIFPYTPAVMLTGAPVLIQLAEIGGEPLVLGLLMTVNLGVAHALTTWRVDLTSMLAIALPVVVCIGYGVWALAGLRVPGDAGVAVLALESDWPRGADRRMLLRDSPRARPRSAIELTRHGMAANPDCQLIVWPESASRPAVPDRQCERGQRLSLELHRPLLASCHDEDDAGLFVAARLYAPFQETVQHRKSRLVRRYETGLFAASDPAGETNLELLSTPVIAAFAPEICYEIHHSADLRRDVRAGAEFIVHTANFATFRSPKIAAWDLAMTQLRAVEIRRSIVRSVNGGAAGMVYASGNWTPGLSADGIGAVCHQVPVSATVTMNVRWGNRVFWSVFILLLITGLIEILLGRGGKNKQPTRGKL